MAELISPVAIGVISDPPTIVVSYDCVRKSGEKRKRRKRKMPLRDFTDRSNVKRYAFNLRQRHSKYLAEIIDVTLEKMLRIIQEIQKGNSVERSLQIVNKEYSIDPDEDLNKLSPAQLAQRKAVMEETFHKNLVKPGDPEFVYDKEVEFDLRNEKSDGNDWDEESEKIKSKNEQIAAKDVENEIPPELVTTDKIPDSPIVQSKAIGKSNNQNVEIPEESKTDIEIGGPSDSNETPNLLKTLDKVQMKPSSLFDNDLPIGQQVKSMHKSGDESSSIHDIDEEGLAKIECGDLEDEDEDFWA